MLLALLVMPCLTLLSLGLPVAFRRNRRQARRLGAVHKAAPFGCLSDEGPRLDGSYGVKRQLHPLQQALHVAVAQREPAEVAPEGG